MNPNPTKFPILSYIMDRLPAFGSKPAFDIEQPSPSSSHDMLAYHQVQESLRVQMPHLNNPEVMKSMNAAISDVVQSRSILQALGGRPNHEAVDTALTKIAEIEEDLLINIQEIVLSPKPVGVDPIKWEEEKIEECKQEAEKEREIYKAVVRLDEMHEAYDNLLKDAENRLEKIYSSVATIENAKDEKVELEEEPNEEVIAILRQGERGAERLDLSERKLRILPEAFGRLSGLTALNLSSNELKTLPDSIAGLEHLQELHLSSNLLESLPDSIGLLLNLKILDVSSNQLKVLPNTISLCRSLIELNIGYNSLVYLPTNIGYELLNLITLYLQYNKLRSLPTSICEMKSLKHLDAHFNELHSLPYSIGRLTNLETLNLGSNFSDLKQLPETFGDLVNLKELDLSNNQIFSLPNTFGKLESLVKLNLDQNPILVPPMEVVNEGVEAVREFMKKRWVEVEEEVKSRVEDGGEGQSGWLQSGVAVVGGWVSMVSGGVMGYFGGGGGGEVPKDAYLDQQL